MLVDRANALSPLCAEGLCWLVGLDLLHPALCGMVRVESRLVVEVSVLLLVEVSVLVFVELGVLQCCVETVRVWSRLVLEFSVLLLVLSSALCGNSACGVKTSRRG